MQEYASGLWLFSLNNKAKRIYKKTFYELWRDWKAELETQSKVLAEKIKAKGITPFSNLTQGTNVFQSLTAYPASSEGYAFVERSLDESTRLTIVKNPSQPSLQMAKNPLGQMSFSRDGKFLAYATYSGIERFTSYTDVYVTDLEKKTL